MLRVLICACATSCLKMYLVEFLGTLQLIVTLRHRLVQSGLHVLQLQHAVCQSGLAALPVLTHNKTKCKKSLIIQINAMGSLEADWL